jgi:hypothetical protein
MSVVYRHIRLDKNEPFYIGIGVDKHRAIRKSYRNKIWNDIVTKTDYRVEILFDDLNKEDAVEKEIELIKLYGRINNSTGSLANLTDGGDNFGKTAWNKGKVMDDETRQKMREISIKNGSKPPSRKGVKDSEETKNKKSLAQLGRTSGTKNKIWINDGISNKMINKNLSILDGWVKGRITNKTI